MTASSVWTARALEARKAVGRPIAAPRPRVKTMVWPGKPLSELDEDRCYEFVRQCGGNRARIAGRRLEALTVVWGFMRELANRPEALTRDADGDAVIGGVSLDAVLNIALPGACGSPRELPPVVDTETIVDTCQSLLADPSGPAARLHALWLRVHFAMDNCSAPAEEDYLMLGRVAALLNPSLGGLAAAYLPEADIDGTPRDRVELMVAQIAMIVFVMLRVDEAVRRVVFRYFFGNHISGGTDPGRAEMADYGDALEAALTHPTYVRTDRISREAYERGLTRAIGTEAEGAHASASFRRWRAVTADALTRLPVEFTCSQAESLAVIMAAIIDAVHAVQPEPHWGEGPERATAAAYSISALSWGGSLDKQHLTAVLYAYYISIEKGKDVTKGAFEDCTPHPDPTLDPQYLAAITAGWSRAARTEWLKAHAETARIRPTTRCWDWTPADSTGEEAGFTPGPNYQNYMWDRNFDGFWHLCEAYRQGELGGPLRLLEEPDYWVMLEAGVWGGELAFSHRRQFEDDGNGVLRHLSGPAEGRARWGLRRMLDLYRSQSGNDESDNPNLGHCAPDTCFFFLYLCVPGCVAWYHLPEKAG